MNDNRFTSEYMNHKTYLSGGFSHIGLRRSCMSTVVLCGQMAIELLCQRRHGVTSLQIPSLYSKRLWFRN